MQISEKLNEILEKKNLEEYVFDDNPLISYFDTVLQAIGEAYGAIGSAYVNDDGTILVAKSKENRELYLKHYVISAKMYQ